MLDRTWWDREEDCAGAEEVQSGQFAFGPVEDEIQECINKLGPIFP